VHSDLHKLKSGVPQWSILDLILFLIYINDISYFIQNLSIVELYAEDSPVHESGYDVKLI